MSDRPIEGGQSTIGRTQKTRLTAGFLEVSFNDEGELAPAFSKPVDDDMRKHRQQVKTLPSLRL